LANQVYIREFFDHFAQSDRHTKPLKYSDSRFCKKVLVVFQRGRMQNKPVNTRTENNIKRLNLDENGRSLLKVGGSKSGKRKASSLAASSSEDDPCNALHVAFTP